MAPRWLGQPVDHEYDDEENEDDDAPEIVRNANKRRREEIVSLTLRSGMGVEVPVTNITHDVNADNSPSSKNINERSRLGIFSQLLLYALRCLRRRRELRLEVNFSFCLIRSELRRSSQQVLLTRKIYITPSTIIYEGPYYEEKCVVTRNYEDHHDQFLRVVFRDEGKTCLLYTSPSPRD